VVDSRIRAVVSAGRDFMIAIAIGALDFGFYSLRTTLPITVWYGYNDAYYDTAFDVVQRPCNTHGWRLNPSGVRLDRPGDNLPTPRALHDEVQVISRFVNAAGSPKGHLGGGNGVRDRNLNRGLRTPNRGNAAAAANLSLDLGHIKNAADGPPVGRREKKERFPFRPTTGSVSPTAAFDSQFPRLPCGNAPLRRKSRSERLAPGISTNDSGARREHFFRVNQSTCVAEDDPSRRWRNDRIWMLRRIACPGRLTPRRSSPWRATKIEKGCSANPTRGNS